jgi:hypothetical protein
MSPDARLVRLRDAIEDGTTWRFLSLIRAFISVGRAVTNK